MVAEAPRSRTEPPRVSREQPILKTGRATGPRSLPGEPEYLSACSPRARKLRLVRERECVLLEPDEMWRDSSREWGPRAVSDATGSDLGRAGMRGKNQPSMRRTSPARGPFWDSSGVNSTRCPSRSSSNTAPRTELRWKKCSIPPSSRMKPKPLSISSRAIVPVGIAPCPPSDELPREHPEKRICQCAPADAELEAPPV